MKNFLGIVGAIIVVATFYNYTQASIVHTTLYLNTAALLLGGGLALLLAKVPRKPGGRFLAGALAGLVLADATALLISGADGNAIGLAVGRGLADWLLIGGGLTLIANAAYPSKPAATPASHSTE